LVYIGARTDYRLGGEGRKNGPAPERRKTVYFLYQKETENDISSSAFQTKSQGVKHDKIYTVCPLPKEQEERLPTTRRRDEREKSTPWSL